MEPSVPQSNKSKTSSSGASEYVHVNTQNSASPTYDPTPGLHTNHLISNYWSEELISYFIFVFVNLFALSLYGCEHLTKAGGMEMMDLSLQQSCYVLNILLIQILHL